MIDFGVNIPISENFGCCSQAEGLPSHSCHASCCSQSLPHRGDGVGGAHCHTGLPGCSYTYQEIVGFRERQTEMDREQLILRERETTHSQRRQQTTAGAVWVHSLQFFLHRRLSCPRFSTPPASLTWDITP